MRVDGGITASMIQDHDLPVAAQPSVEQDLAGGGGPDEGAGGGRDVDPGMEGPRLEYGMDALAEGA